MALFDAASQPSPAGERQRVTYLLATAENELLRLRETRGAGIAAVLTRIDSLQSMLSEMSSGIEDPSVFEACDAARTATMRFRQTLYRMLDDEQSGTTSTVDELLPRAQENLDSLDSTIARLVSAIDGIGDEDRRRMEEAIATAQRIGTGLAVGCVALGILFAYLLGAHFTSRVARLLDGAEAQANGSFGTRIPATGRDELSRVAAAFNTMAERLERQEADRGQHIPERDESWFAAEPRAPGSSDGRGSPA